MQSNRFGLRSHCHDGLPQTSFCSAEQLYPVSEFPFFVDIRVTTCGIVESAKQAAILPTLDRKKIATQVSGQALQPLGRIWRHRYPTSVPLHPASPPELDNAVVPAFDVTKIFDATKITEHALERLERTEGHAGDEQTLGRVRSAPRLRSLEICAPLYESLFIK
jgi:hypothetical protein